MQDNICYNHSIFGYNELQGVVRGDLTGLCLIRICLIINDNIFSYRKGKKIFPNSLDMNSPCHLIACCNICTLVICLACWFGC
jgi:hypothetical protein